MPTIAEAAQMLAADNLPILFVDTCILLDIIRAPFRRIQRCVKSAVELAEMQSRSACRIVASSMIEAEWKDHEPAVIAELERHLLASDQAAVVFHEACAHLKVQLSFGQAHYQEAGLAAKLGALSGELLHKAVHLMRSDETDLKALNRNRAGLRPAQKGNDAMDCIIIEEYFELCRLLQALGFAMKRVFCSSNTQDYEDGRKLPEALAIEFNSVGLAYTNVLEWAVNELKKTNETS